MAFTHQKNSNFQYSAFGPGRAHTADECYRLLMNELEERLHALNVSNAGYLRTEAKKLRAKQVLEDDDLDMADKLEAQAELAEIEAGADMVEKCYRACEREISFLKECIAVITPYRKYAHLPDHEAFEACQREEWAEEFKFRAESCFIANQPIPTDQISAMRQHPDWLSHIMPHLSRIQVEKGIPATSLMKPQWKLHLEAKLQGALPPGGVLAQLPGSGPESIQDGEKN